MATTTLTSFAEFERMDFGEGKVELLRGEVLRMPPPFFHHQNCAETLFKRLDALVENLRQSTSARLGRVHHEMGYRLAGEPASWLQPDVSLTHPDQPVEKYYLGAPLLAFEVVSDSQSAAEVDAKVSEYLANGAAEVWMIYPKQRHAWVFTPDGAARRETGAIRSSLLPGIEIALSEIL